MTSNVDYSFPIKLNDEQIKTIKDSLYKGGKNGKR